MRVVDTAAAQNEISEPGPSAAGDGPRYWRSVLHLVERFGLLGVTGIMFAFFALNGDSGAIFLSSENLSNILGDQAIVGLVALSMLVPLVAGYFNLSAAANAGVVNVAVAAVMSKYGWPPVAAIALGLAVGGLLGFLSGFLVAALELNAFIVSFGMYVLVAGVAQWYTKGNTITENIPSSVGDWGSADWLGLPRPCWLLIAVALAIWFVISQTPFGRHLETIGSNESAAKLVGIRTRRTVWMALAVSGLLDGIAGCLLTSRQGGADASVGPSYLFPALAALFLGATTIRPGKYNVWGTVIGVYFVAIAVSGLILMGVDASIQQVFNGAALVAAVALSTFSARGRAKREENGQRRGASLSRQSAEDRSES
jgi:ribose transport system permease protein